MATYTVMARPEDATREDAIFVSDHFNGWAVIFGPVWALVNRMWIVAVLLLCLMIASGLLPNMLAFPASLGIAILSGLYAGELKLWSLTRRGYQEVAHVSASSMEEAELRFYFGQPQQPVVPVPLAPAAVPQRLNIDTTDPLGLFGTGG